MWCICCCCFCSSCCYCCCCCCRCCCCCISMSRNVSCSLPYKVIYYDLHDNIANGIESFVSFHPGLPTCTDFRGTYRFWPSITISRFHAVVCRFWKMREFVGLSDFGLFCFRRYSRILPAFCTYRQSRRCVAAINSPPYVMNQC